jgi:hypothetical protein
LLVWLYPWKHSVEPNERARLAELDPAFGASTAINEVNLVPYADTGGNFPGAGLARLITPGDTPFARQRPGLPSFIFKRI